MGGVWSAIWDEGREPFRSLMKSSKSEDHSSQWEVYDMGRWIWRHCEEINMPPELINIIGEYSTHHPKIMPHAFLNLAQKTSCAGCRFRLLFSRPNPMPAETE